MLWLSFPCSNSGSMRCGRSRSNTSETGTSTGRKMTVPSTAEEKTCKKNDVKARSLLLMALPNEHQLTFDHSLLCINQMCCYAIKARFGEEMKQQRKDTEWLCASSTNNINTVNPEVSTATTKVKTASTEISIATFSDATVYAFLSTQPQGSQLVHKDLEQLHDDGLEEMDLKECKAPKSKDNINWNQGISSKAVKIEDASEKAMCAIDGTGFDWSNMAEEDIQANMALIAFSDSEVTNDKSCFKSCLKNYEALKKQYDDLLVKLDDTVFKAATYKRGLTTLEEQIIKYREHEVLFSEEIALLKRSIGHKEYQMGLLRNELEKVKQRKKRRIEFKIAKFDKSAKDLSEMLASQITDKSKKGFGYNVVPSPHPLILNRPTPLDLSYSGLEEFKQPEVNEYGPRDSSLKPTIGCDKESNNSKENTDDSLEQHQKTDTETSSVKSSLKVDKDWKEKFFCPANHVREVELKKVRENNDAPIIEDWVSDDEDDDESNPKVKKKSVIPTSTQKEFVKPEKQVKRSVSAYKHMVPRAVLMKTGLKYVNTASPVNTVRSVNISRPFSTARFINTVRPSYTAHPKSIIHCARPRTYFKNQAQSTVHMPFYKRTALTKGCFNQSLNTGRPFRSTVNTIRARGFNVVKPSACWVWRPIKPNGASLSNSQLNEKGFVDSGCSRHMTGNKAHLFVEEHMEAELLVKMCDKKNYDLFTNSECLVLSPNFKLPDENQILLKIPRQDNMYSFYMNNIVPKDSLTCLVAKATSEESMLWHRRLGHINFKNINKPVKENLVRDLPLKRFENDQTCVACLKRKQHRASSRTPQQNGVAERRNRILIEAARTMLANSKLPTIFWAEAVCNTPILTNIAAEANLGYYFIVYKEFLKKSHDDSSLKDNGTADQQVNTARQEINPGSREVSTALPEVNTATPEDLVGPIPASEDTQVEDQEIELGNISTILSVRPLLNRIHKDHPIEHVIGDVQSYVQTRRMKTSYSEQGFLSAIYEGKSHQDLHTCLFACFLSQEEPKRVSKALSIQKKKDERGIVIRNKARLVAQGHTQEEGIEYDEVFAPMARIEAYDCPHQAPRACSNRKRKAFFPVKINMSMNFEKVQLHNVKSPLLTPDLESHWFKMEMPEVMNIFIDHDISVDYLISHPCQISYLQYVHVQEYEAAASLLCTGLWLQNQLLDYGYNFMNTVIYIDNNSTICIIENPVQHSKTKHIEIRHHFIRDCNAKKLIQMVKIDTEHNVADLLTKGFDAGRFQYLVSSLLKLLMTIMEKCQLTATIDSHSLTITKASLRRHLKLDDHDGITSIPNSEIFEQLALMGYHTDSDKLTFQKGAFSPQ
ncbi:putative ribonuclease H-like domain-containing protein [Tanacetum coccineum]